MKVHVDIDYGSPEKNFQVSEDGPEHWVAADKNVRELWEAMQLLEKVYGKAMAGLKGMHAQAIEDQKLRLKAKREAELAAQQDETEHEKAENE